MVQGAEGTGAGAGDGVEVKQNINLTEKTLMLAKIEGRRKGGDRE